MKEAQEIRAHLESERKGLLDRARGELRRTASGLTAIGDLVSGDSADLADAVQESSVASLLSAAAQERLADVEAALLRLGTEKFGICIDCGEAINPERLAARPWVTR